MRIRGNINWPSILGPIVILAADAPAWSAEVEITGGKPQGNIHQFVWTVVNNGTRTITRFRVPHYGGNEGFGAPGWTLTNMTGSVRRGGAKPGHIEWHAATPAAAILPGGSLAFNISITQAGIYESSQTVTVGFADGATLEITGVMCPAREPFLRRNLPAVGLGVLFAIFIVCKTFADRRRARTAAGR